MGQHLEHALNIINKTLKEHGYAEKLLPSSDIIKRIELSAKICEDKRKCLKIINR